MALLNLSLPVIGQSSATEDQKIRDALAGIQTAINGGLDESNVPNLAAVFTTYKTIRVSQTQIPTSALGTYIAFPAGNMILNGGAGTGFGVFFLNPADYAVTTRTTKIRLRSVIITNAVAPASTFTTSLAPVTTLGGASGASPTATVAGATVSNTHTTPAASATNIQDSADVNFPAAGYFVFGLNLSAAMAAGSLATALFELQVRQV